MVFPVGAAAALILGLGYVLQQRVVATEPMARMLTIRLLLDLVHRRMWWAGIGCMVLGELPAGLALQLTTMAVVEPLLSTSLLLALVFAAALARHRPHWHEVVGAVLLSASLGAFISVGNPHSSTAPEPNSAVTALAACTVLAVVCVLVAIGAGPGSTSSSGPRCSASCSQSAFKAARLNYSLPPVAAAEPIAGIALGVSLLGDVVSVSVPGLTVESVCVAGMVVGVALIGRSRSLASDCVALSPVRAGPADPV